MPADLPACMARPYARLVSSPRMGAFVAELAATPEGSLSFTLDEAAHDLELLARSCVRALGAEQAEHPSVPTDRPAVAAVRAYALEVRALLDRCADLGLDLDAIAGDHPLGCFICDGVEADRWMMGRGFSPSAVYKNKCKAHLAQRKGWMR